MVEICVAFNGERIFWIHYTVGELWLTTHIDVYDVLHYIIDVTGKL